MINSTGEPVGQPALGPRHARPAEHPLSGTRAAVLRTLIGAAEPMTVAALAEQLGQHPNTVREHLDSLVAAGRTERLRSQPVGRGRPAWLYRAVGPGASRTDPEAAAGGGVRPDALGTEGEEYAGLAIALIDEVSRSTPDPRGMARQAGERWGRTMAQRRPDPTAGIAPCDGTDPSGAVVDMLTGLRFEPQPAATPGTVRLTTCPLLDAARRNPDVVCEVHLGIVRGALTTFGGDPDAVDLIPFAEPGACLLTLPSRQ